MSIMVLWSFQDDFTKERNGLSLNLLNGSVGYAVSDKVSLGIDFGLQLSRLLGSKNAAGNTLPVSLRAYAGPAAMIVFMPNLSLQVSGVIDIATKEINRGQGIFTAFWHQF